MKQSTHASQIGTSASRLPNERLKAQRLKKNWTQVYVATQIGANDTEMSRWETGSAIPSLYFREQLCTLFRMTPEELGFVSSLDGSTQDRSNVSTHLWHVPYRRNPFFTGREERLAHLHEQLQAAHGGAPSIQVICGLGGIGKTQLALEYAYRYRHDYTAVAWVQADTAKRLRSELAALAELLHLPEQQAQDQEQAVRAVMRWFAEHANWLLILDNVEDITLVSPTIPAESGHVLLTTRAQASGAFARHVNLETMSLDEGMLFLLRRAKMLGGGTPLEQAGDMFQEHARAIVRELDGLPLALDQAGAYIEETGCSLSGYLDRYHVRRADVLNRRGHLTADHPQSVSTTFALSYEQVERTNEAAADLLRFCAFLDPDAIPEELFAECASELGPVLGPVAADRLACDEALAVLRSYSLVQRHAESGTLTTHRLVQVVLKDRMDEDTRRQWAERALRAVHGVFPREGAIETPLCQRYLPHAQCCIQWISQEHLYFPEAVQLLTWTGTYLKDRARYSEAEQMLQDARHLQERLPQPAYQSLAETLHRLGQLYFEQGRYSQTQACWQEALALQEEHLETHYHEKAKTLNHLGTLYLEQGRTREAEPLFQQALFLYEQMEPGHPVGIHSLISQGWCYMQQGRYQEAEPLLQRALALLEQGGPQHLFMIHNVHHLGRLYTLQGYYQKAEECFQCGLALWEQLEFPHPCTARIFNGLASLCIRQGKHGEAEAYFRRAITFWEQLHFQYPLLSESLYGLALLLIERGNDSEAEPLLQRALNIREHWLGQEHPETLATAASYRDLLVRMHREEEQIEDTAPGGFRSSLAPGEAEDRALYPLPDG
jgi:tetratricopeptide (TPR) repeat protein/DNA-binding XRE family transcriptional regulator